MQAIKIEKNVAAAMNKPTITVGGLQLVGADDCKVGRSKNGDGRKYSKYDDAIAPHVQWLRDAIAESKDHYIRVRIRDIAKEMGSDFVKKHDTSIYWGLKYVLFFEGIVVESGTGKSKEKMLLMRMATPLDKLPDSLVKETKVKPDVPKTKVEAKPKVVPDVQAPVADVQKPATKIPMTKRLVTAIRLGELPESVIDANADSKIEGESVQA